MFDLVPHGPPDFTPLAKEHPEWVSLDADGQPQYAGAYTPSTMPIRAGRTTCAAPPNGTRSSTRHRVAGGLRGGRPLNWNPSWAIALRGRAWPAAWVWTGRSAQGFLKVDREVVLLPEEYSGANIFYRVADLTYDAQLYFLLVDLHARRCIARAVGLRRCSSFSTTSS